MVSLLLQSPGETVWLVQVGILFPLPKPPTSHRPAAAPPRRVRAGLPEAACYCLLQWESGSLSAVFSLETNRGIKTTRHFCQLPQPRLRKHAR